MPRIPVRVEPYTSATRQRRHFKSKRDLILRQLSKASFINGSQFAIMWTTAAGDIEYYGSPAFQPKLDYWFNADVSADALATAQMEQVRLETDKGAVERDYETMLEQADVDDEMGQVSDQGEGSVEDADTFNTSGPISQTDSTLAPIDANASDVFGRTDDLSPDVSPPPNSAAACLLSSSRKRPRCENETLFETEAQVLAYLTAKVNEMQQTACKLIVKSWIKTIEPKKQTTNPYTGGDDTKPNWWPHHVRHKEPDHLQKHERIDLIVSILLSPYAGMTHLELASGEYNAFLSPEKHAILRDIYAVARGYENMLKVQGDGVFSPFAVSMDIAAPIPEHEIPASPPKQRKRPRRAMKGGKATRAQRDATLALQSGSDVPIPSSSAHHLLPSLVAPMAPDSPWGPHDTFYAPPLHSPLAPALDTPWRGPTSTDGESPFPTSAGPSLDARAHPFLDSQPSPYFDPSFYARVPEADMMADTARRGHTQREDHAVPSILPEPAFVLRPPPGMMHYDS